MIQNRPALGTLLALDGLNYSEPWRNPLLGCATKFGRFLHRLVNNRTYRLIQFLLLLGNLPINMIAVRSLSIEHSQWVDVGLLLNSLADGLLRVAVVGSELLFRYPALFIHDIVLPMLLCTFHLSGLRFGRQMRWSLLLPLRVLTLPDRYLSAVGAQGPRTLLRTLMAAKRQLATVFALLLSFLFLASAMSVRQWTLNEQMGHVFEPPELPVTFNSVMFTLAHLYSVVFTGSFDVATQAFRERSSFCGVSDPHLSLSQHVEALIRDAIDRSPPTVVWIDRNQSNVYPLNVSSAQWLIQKGEVSDWLHSPDYRLPFISPIPPALWTYIDSLSPIPLFFCAIDIRTPTVSLVFSSQLFELVRRIQYRCVALQQQSTNSYKKLENCNLNGTTVQRNLFFVRLNQIFQELLTDHHGRLQQYLKIKNNPAETPESVNKLQVIESLCNYERLYANSSRDPSRFDSQALLDQLVDRYLYTSLHHAFQMQRDRNTLQRYDLNAGMCANPKWILIFYVLVFAIGRLLILNMFRAVVLNRYELERLRQTNAIRPIDVEAFLNSWKRYCVSIRSRSQTVADSNRLDSKMMDSGGWTETAKPSTIDPSRSSIYDAVVARVLQLQAQLKRTSDGTASQLSPATDSKDWPSSGVGLPNTDPDTFELNQNVPRDGGLGSGGSGGPGSERVGFTATTPDATESSARPQTTSEPASGTSTVESLYLPIRYALLFLREMAPLKFRLSACSEESALCILGRYALRVRESDMTVHGFDLLAVCCAHRLNCSPQMFQAHFRHMLQTLADTINRHCPDYDFDECQFITMPAYLNGFYFGKLLLNSVLQQKVLHHFSISRNPSTSNE